MKRQHVLSLSTLTAFLFLSLAAPALATWEEGVAAFQAGKYHQAVAKFRDVVNRSPESPEGYYMLGLSFLQQRQPKEALEPLRTAVELGGQTASYRLTLAQAQVVARDTSSALSTLSALDASSLGGKELAAYHKLLARSASISANHAQARDLLESAVAKNPKAKELHVALAQVAEKSEQTEVAFRALDQAFLLDVSDLELGRRAVYRAFQLAKSTQGDERVAWYRRGAEVARRIQQSAPSAESALLLGEAEMGAKDLKAARRWFEYAAEAEPLNPLPHFYLARCALAEEAAEQALEFLDRALECQPADELLVQVHAVRGLSLRHLERFEDAAGSYRLAGNSAKEAEMMGLAETKRQNDKARAQCVSQRKELEDLMRESADLQGTDTWTELKERHQAVLDGCSDFFES